MIREGVVHVFEGVELHAKAWKEPSKPHAASRSTSDGEALILDDETDTISSDFIVDSKVERSKNDKGFGYVKRSRRPDCSNLLLLIASQHKAVTSRKSGAR
jgi:hypothetical protein